MAVEVCGDCIPKGYHLVVFLHKLNIVALNWDGIDKNWSDIFWCEFIEVFYSESKLISSLSGNIFHFLKIVRTITWNELEYESCQSRLFTCKFHVPWSKYGSLVYDNHPMLHQILLAKLFYCSTFEEQPYIISCTLALEYGEVRSKQRWYKSQDSVSVKCYHPDAH